MNKVDNCDSCSNEDQFCGKSHKCDHCDSLDGHPFDAGNSPRGGRIWWILCRDCASESRCDSLASRRSEDRYAYGYEDNDFSYQRDRNDDYEDFHSDGY